MEKEEEYWCERCCNFDREHIHMDGMAICAVTGTLAFCQDYGGDCIAFGRPAKELRILIGKTTTYCG